VALQAVCSLTALLECVVLCCHNPTLLLVEAGTHMLSWGLLCLSTLCSIATNLSTHRLLIAVPMWCPAAMSQNPATPCRRQALDRGGVLERADKIATGHNADDIAETILLNIIRGDVPR
jgi:hypothetical protein